MKLIIAEKPSVAREIAKIVGATKGEKGYKIGNDYLVSWCFGHLIELATPDAYGEEYEKWDVIPRQVNWFAIAGVLIGAAVANLVPWGIASVNGMVIAAVCYLVGELVERKKK